MKQPLNRRQFCIYSAGLLAGASATAANAQKTRERPWFIPDYGSLPTLKQQLEPLGERARTVQLKPRTVDSISVTGLPRDLGDFDNQVIAKMKEGGLVGLTCAIAIHGKLVVARGYGNLSSHDSAPATPTSPGYIGSITKPLCAMAALALVRDDKLKLDARVLDVLPLEPLLKAGETRQPEIDKVTVRMLMNHTSGLFNFIEPLFDRPYYAQLAAAGQLRLVHDDVSQYDLVRRGMSIPYVSPPGREAHYSGQGLQVLGRIIEQVSGRRLDQFMMAGILSPCGVRHHATVTYLPPKTRLAINRGAGSECGCFVPSSFDPGLKKCVSWKIDGLDAPFGNNWGGADACGSSMLSALDLVRFICRFPSLLGPPLFKEAMTHPKVKNETFHGLGWGCGQTNGAYQFGHGGAIPGARAFCESTWDGVQYSVLAAGDHDASFDAIQELVVRLGRELKPRRMLDGLWGEYGYQRQPKK